MLGRFAPSFGSLRDLVSTQPLAASSRESLRASCFNAACGCWFDSLAFSNTNIANYPKAMNAAALVNIREIRGGKR